MRTGRQKFSFLCTASNLRSNEIQSRFVEFEKEERERVVLILSLFSLAFSLSSPHPPSLARARSLSLALCAGLLHAGGRGAL